MKPFNQRDIFWKEVNLIQKRHLPFFPDEQRKYIKMRKTDTGYSLGFREGHALSQTIILEIQFAFKLAQDICDDIRPGDRFKS